MNFCKYIDNNTRSLNLVFQIHKENKAQQILFQKPTKEIIQTVVEEVNDCQNILKKRGIASYDRYIDQVTDSDEDYSEFDEFEYEKDKAYSHYLFGIPL